MLTVVRKSGLIGYCITEVTRELRNDLQSSLEEAIIYQRICSVDFQYHWLKSHKLPATQNYFLARPFALVQTRNLELEYMDILLEVAGTLGSRNNQVSSQCREKSAAR